jgi:ABC-type multidrug transport system fused ATPase/permease subunit
MKVIARLLPYLRPYMVNVWLNVACNILMVLFSLVSIPVLMPFLQLLLGLEVPPIAQPEFAWTVKAMSQTFYYQLGHIIQLYGRERALIYVSATMIALFFFKNLFRYGSNFFSAPLRNGIVRDLRQQLFQKSLRLPLSYYSEERKGDLLSRISTDVQEIEWSIIGSLENVVREPLTIAGAMFVMLRLSPSLTGFVVILLGATALIIGGLGRTLKRDSGDLQARLGSLVSVLEEALSGMRVIKAFNAEKYQAQKFGVENNGYRNLLIRILRRRDLSSPLTEFLGIVIVCILIWFGFKRVELHELDGAGFLAFIYAFFTVIEPAKSLSQTYYQIQKGGAALDRVDKILKAEEIITEIENPITIERLTQKIEYKNVSFRYRAEEKTVLKNFSLTIPKGHIVALVGASGAGKSTLADLLPRFFEVNEGSIEIDGTDIRQFSLQSLRGLMGIVTQEAVLFNDTIYNNIVFGLENVTATQVEAAARAANAHDFILQTERGYQTNIGDRGTKLSGGQRQRLTIARALLKNPDILILDEATSALDSESEQLVQAALGELMRNRTALVIAHRLSTIQNATNIVVLRQGEIVEQGTHEQLLVQRGEYFKLVEMQALA